MPFPSDSFHNLLDSEDPPSAWDGTLLTWEDTVLVVSDDLPSGLQGDLCLHQPT